MIMTLHVDSHTKRLTISTIIITDNLLYGIKDIAKQISQWLTEDKIILAEMIHWISNDMLLGAQNTKQNIDAKVQSILEKAIFQLRYNWVYSRTRRAKPLYQKLEPLCRKKFINMSEPIKVQVGDRGGSYTNIKSIMYKSQLSEWRDNRHEWHNWKTFKIVNGDGWTQRAISYSWPPQQDLRYWCDIIELHAKPSDKLFDWYHDTAEHLK